MKAEKLIWSLEWYSKEADELVGEIEIDHSRVDPERLRSALELAPDTPLVGGLPVNTAACAEYLKGVTGHEFALDRYDYFIEVLRLP